MRVGPGNILGVTGAIAVGGPGALFWMIVAACVGIATKYTECMLAVKYRVVDAAGPVLDVDICVFRDGSCIHGGCPCSDFQGEEGR